MKGASREQLQRRLWAGIQRREAAWVMRMVVRGIFLTSITYFPWEDVGDIPEIYKLTGECKMWKQRQGAGERVLCGHEVCLPVCNVHIYRLKRRVESRSTTVLLKTMCSV